MLFLHPLNYNCEASLFYEGCLDRRNMGERKERDQENKWDIMFTRKFLVRPSNIKVIKILRRLYLKKIIN